MENCHFNVLCLSKLTLFLEILLELNGRRSGTLGVPQIHHDLCKSILLSRKGNSNTHFIAFLLQYKKKLQEEIFAQYKMLFKD